MKNISVMSGYLDRSILVILCVVSILLSACNAGLKSQNSQTSPSKDVFSNRLNYSMTVQNPWLSVNKQDLEAVIGKMSTVIITFENKSTDVFDIDQVQWTPPANWSEGINSCTRAKQLRVGETCSISLNYAPKNYLAQSAFVVTVNGVYIEDGFSYDYEEAIEIRYSALRPIFTNNTIESAQLISSTNNPDETLNAKIIDSGVANGEIIFDVPLYFDFSKTRKLLVTLPEKAILQNTSYDGVSQIKTINVDPNTKQLNFTVKAENANEKKYVTKFELAKLNLVGAKLYVCGKEISLTNPTSKITIGPDCSDELIQQSIGISLNPQQAPQVDQRIKINCDNLNCTIAAPNGSTQTIILERILAPLKMEISWRTAEDNGVPLLVPGDNDNGNNIDVDITNLSNTPLYINRDMLKLSNDEYIEITPPINAGVNSCFNFNLPSNGMCRVKLKAKFSEKKVDELIRDGSLELNYGYLTYKINAIVNFKFKQITRSFVAPINSVYFKCDGRLASTAQPMKVKVGGTIRCEFINGTDRVIYINNTHAHKVKFTYNQCLNGIINQGQHAHGYRKNEGCVTEIYADPAVMPDYPNQGEYELEYFDYKPDVLDTLFKRNLKKAYARIEFIQ